MLRRHAAARRQLRPFVSLVTATAHAADRITPTCDPNRVPSCWVEHGGSTGPRLVPVPRDVPEPLPPPTGRAAARIFLRDATTVTAGRLPAAPSTAAGLSLRSAATGPDTGRDARHRGGLSDAKAGGGDAATRLSAVVLA
jgi:hypothetical protein